MPKNWCFWTVVLKTLESPLDCKEIQQVHSEGDQPCDFFGRNDAKAESPVLWPPHVKSWLIGKDFDAGRDWGQEEKGRPRMRWLDGITDSMDVSLSESGSWWWTGRPGVLRFMALQSRTRLSNWTELNFIIWGTIKSMLSLAHTLYIFLYKTETWNFKSNSEEVRILCICDEISESVSERIIKKMCYFTKLSVYLTTFRENHY